MGDFGSPTLSFPPLGADTSSSAAPFGTPLLGSRAFLPDARGAMSPRLGGMGFNHGEGPETTRRAVEWDRQIENLDQKELEIHQTQLRLVREQTANFRADIVVLRQEMVDIRNRSDKQITQLSAVQNETAGRTANLERVVQELSEAVKEGFGKHGTLFQDVDRKLQQISNNINEHHRVIQRHASAMEKIELLEKAIVECNDKHGASITEAQTKLEALTGRMTTAETNHTTLKGAHDGLETGHKAVAERVTNLEKLVGESNGKHTGEIEAVKAAHAALLKDSGARCTALETHNTTAQSRLTYLEGSLGHSAEKPRTDVKTVAERLALIEQKVGTTADKDDLQRTEKKQGETLDSLTKSQQEIQKNLTAFSTSHGTQNERIAYLEKIIGDSAEKQNREIDSLKQATTKLQAESKGHSQNHGATGERVEAIVKAHVSVEDRIAYIERAMGDSIEKQAREINALKTAHTGHQTNGKDLQVKQTTFEDRLDFIEKTIGDSQDKHNAQLSAIHMRQEQLQSKVTDHDKLRSKHEGDINTQKDRFMQHHSTVEERFEFLEKAIGDSADKSIREIESVKNAHAKLVSEGKEVRGKQSSVEERLYYVENWFRGFK